MKNLQSTKFEIILIYLDITGKTIKKKDLTKIIKKFIESKKKKNPLSKFGLLFFKEGGHPDFLEDVDDTSLLIKKISDEWNTREVSESFLENGLFYCLSYIASKATEKGGDFRVIVISDFPSNKSEDYHDALLSVLSAVRYIPTFIDIIRIGQQRFFSDDVKLRIITTTASGGLFYAENSKELESKLVALTKNKRMASLNQIEGKIYIDEENKDFYENLASEMLTPEPGETGKCYLCNSEYCEDCEEEFSKFLKCTCGALFHTAHIGKYSFENNVGLPHIFRCPSCDNMLKMNELTVLKINGITPPPPEEEYGEIYETEEEITQEEVYYEEPDEPEIEKYLEEIPKETEPISTGNGRSMPLTPAGYSFFQQPIQSTLRKPPIQDLGEENRSLGESVPKIVQPVSPSIEKGTFGLSPPGANGKTRKRRIRRFLLCSICGTSNSAFETGNTCKNCGAPLK